MTSATSGRLRLGQLHLAENGAGNEHRRHAADLGADMFPAPAVFALDAEQLFGEFGSSRDGNIDGRTK
jgi:hypothetical protein